MPKKRSRVELIYSILKIIMENKNSIRYTHLLRSSNISSAGFSKYMVELTEKDFIKEIRDKNGTKYYSLSDRGFHFLEKYNAIRKFIQEFDL
ncbi:MAG: winged helix-turn-helix domain-containing protein [Candidatus Pacearchaeota archaeon]|jgi:predicted transcriptional regulator